MKKIDKIQKALDPLEWIVRESGDDFEFETWSPLGENLVVCANKKSVAKDLVENYNDFDAEEHAVMWYEARNGAPRSIRALLYDADKIDEMFEELAKTVCAIEKEDFYKYL